MSSEPPPTYSQQEPALHHPTAVDVEPQVLIIPTANNIGFQKGYLGADSERAAVEGEVHIKGASSGRWGKVTLSLRTVEAAHEHEIELNYSEVVLFTSNPSDPAGYLLPSALLFSIPLPPDTPQCIHTFHSSLTHTLSVTLHPVEVGSAPFTKSLTIHTRRYTARSYVLGAAPETKAIDDPTRVEVQVPRTSFKAGEPIPLYLTVPSPRRELILDQGLRLRNIRAELVRILKVKRDDGTEEPISNYPSEREGTLSSGEASASTSVLKQNNWATSHPLDLRSLLGVPGGGEVVAMSGASCRLHPSRSLRIRLVLHPPHDHNPLPSGDLPVGDIGRQEPASECALISEETLLHSVSFVVCIHITLMHMSTHTERISTITIPVAILPPSAPLPEVEESIDSAYRKKHDRPPTRTVRMDDTDAPYYEEGEAGPSFLASGAPPPFEEREAPPPFFPAEPEASTSRLPTFLESETEIYVPSHEDPSIAPPPPPPDLVFEGEGVLFGFLPSDQFDGYNHEQERPGTPPPTLEMATRDPDVTELATLTEGAAIDALELALEHHPDANDPHRDLPPPPPLLDDPSDPPPSIDSDFRSPDAHRAASPSLSHAPPAFTEPSGSGGPPPPPPMPSVSDSSDQVASHGHAPPPYRVPDHRSDVDVDHEHADVARPPPYVG